MQENPYGDQGSGRRKASQILTERSPPLVFVFSVITLGIYLIYWYNRVYAEWRELTGKTPTGNDFLVDLLLAVVTCGVWGIYIDFRISQEITKYRTSRGIPGNDTTIAVLVLDIAAYITLTFTYLISSALQQDLLNDLLRDEVAA